MSASFKNRRTDRLFLGSLALCMFAVISLPIIFPIYVYGQVPGKVRNLDVEFVPEPGCPVAVTNGRAELDLDPFEVPIDARIYIDYKNISERAISAVKFRLRFTDPEMKDRGTWHAPDMELLAPGASGTEKWKHEKVDPRTTSLKVRILQVKFQDNSNWMSVKMSELATPAAGATGGGGAAAPAAPPQPQQAQQAQQSQQSNSIIPDIPAQQAAPVNQTPPGDAGGQAAPANPDHSNNSDPFTIGR